MIYNNIRLYPFDTDEDDEEEIHLNESIRVGLGSCFIEVRLAHIRHSKSFLLPLSVQKTM